MICRCQLDNMAYLNVQYICEEGPWISVLNSVNDVLRYSSVSLVTK